MNGLDLESWKARGKQWQARVSSPGFWQGLLDFFASLRLTVALLAFAVLIVFVGTLDQVHLGIRHAQDTYFESVVAWTPVLALGELFYTQSYEPELAWLKLPLPGGALLGFLLVINLGCAHFRHFKARWTHVGISMIHGGLVVLLVSGFLIGALQEESQMMITEGESSNYSQSLYERELVLIDQSNPATDRVISIDGDSLRAGRAYRLPDGMTVLRVHEYYRNSQILPLAANPDVPETAADRGLAVQPGFTAVPRRYNMAAEEQNVATAVVEVLHRGESLGTWLLSDLFVFNGLPAQTLEIEGRAHVLALRNRRIYYPFRVALDDFTFQRWPGTDIPRDYRSEVRLIEANGSERPVKIFMNHPMRHAGLTFYQASFGRDEHSTVLQVVKNPAATLPYWAVLIIGLGLLVHFAMNFLRFVGSSGAKRSLNSHSQR